MLSCSTWLSKAGRSTRFTIHGFQGTSVLYPPELNLNIHAMHYMGSRLKILSIVTYILAFGFLSQLNAQEVEAKSTKHEKPVMKDSLDGKFDFSSFLIDSKGFIPIPFIITEPALGNIGGVLALAFISPKEIPEGQTYVAPDITLGMGMYTANNSWMVGGGRIGSFPKRGIKYRAFTGYASLNLSFYRTFESAGEKEYEFNLGAFPVLLSLSKSLPRTDLYLGAQYSFSKTKVDPLFVEDLPDWVSEDDLDTKTGSLGIFTDWDRRDNFFTPNKGTILHILYAVDDDWTASDYSYQRLHVFANWFFPIKERWISGIRLESQHVFDDPPFYLLPSLNMRGVPAARYQGATTAIVETEQRFDLNLRWSVLGFGGLGKAVMRDEEFSDAKTIYNYGAGFRYLIARAFGIRAGIDVAMGPDNFGWYIVFGHNWNR